MFTPTEGLSFKAAVTGYRSLMEKERAAVFLLFRDRNAKNFIATKLTVALRNLY